VVAVKQRVERALFLTARMVSTRSCTGCGVRFHSMRHLRDDAADPNWSSARGANQGEEKGAEGGTHAAEGGGGTPGEAVRRTGIVAGRNSEAYAAAHAHVGEHPRVHACVLRELHSE